jgi:predicted RND superfamily exporter protein
LLGNELQEVIPREFHRTFLGLVAIVLVLLLVGFRGFRDVFLLVVTMALVFACLGGAMTWLGMQWNFFNLAAILLLLGTGVDYSILFILALRRNGGDVADAQRHIGLVVALCGAAAAAGFGSIAWASNMGLASLGKTCALGLVLDAVISIFLLPVVWKMFHPATMSDGSD